MYSLCKYYADTTPSHHQKQNKKKGPALYFLEVFENKSLCLYGFYKYWQKEEAKKGPARIVSASTEKRKLKKKVPLV